MILTRFNQMHVKEYTSSIWHKYRICMFVFALFLVPRVISLGPDMSNYDASYWYPRMSDFTKNLVAGNYLMTYEKYHPGVILLWLSGFSQYLFINFFKYIRGHDPSNLAQQFPKINFVSILPLVLTISVLNTWIFYFLSKLTNKRFALIYAVMFSFEPFFLGVSRYLHLSALGASFCYLSFIMCLYYYLVPQKSNRVFYISAIMAGLAMLTKIDSMIGIVFNFLIISFYEYKAGGIKIALKKSFIYGLITFLTFYSLFPSMWVAPWWTLRKIYTDGVLDTAFSSGGEPTISRIRKLFYFEYVFLRSLPTTFFLLLCGLFSCVANFRIKDKVTRTVLIAGTFYFLFFMGFLMIPDKTKDRYISNFFPAYIMVSAYAFYLMDQSSKYLRYTVWTVVLFFYAITFYRYHPVYSMYYTDFVGGPGGIERLGVPIKNRGEYYAQAAEYINTHDKDAPNRNAIILVPEEIRTVKPFFFGNVYSNPRGMPGNKKGLMDIRVGNLD